MMWSRSTLLLITLVGIVMCLIGFGLGAWFQAPVDSLRSSAVEPVTAEVKVENRVLAEPVVVTGRYSTGRKTEITVSGGDAPSVVTELAVKTGDALRSGDPVAKISGRPVIALHGRFPLYRDLEIGDRGDDARELNDILRDLGYASGGSQIFTEATARGIEQLYGAVKAEAPRAAVENPDASEPSKRTAKFRLSDFYFLPSASVTVTSISAVGTTLDGDDASLGSVRAGENQMTARIEAKDIDAFAEGSTMTAASADGATDAITVEVSSVSEFREADDAEEQPPGYDVRFTLQGEVPKTLTDGATMSITAEPESHSESTAVPLSAVRTEGTKNYVLLPGDEAQKCFVTTGAEASGWVEISTDCVQAGDSVVVGP